MNDLTPWEKQLESWTPRRPSERLKQQLFGVVSEPAAAPLSPPVRPTWVWLAPAMCLLLVTLSLGVWMTRTAGAGYVADMSNSNMLASLSFRPGAFGVTAPTDARSTENKWIVAVSDRGLSLTSTVTVLKTNLHF